MIIIRGTASFAPGEIERLRPQLSAYVDYARRQDGCIDYCYAVDLKDPNVLHVIEAWRDEAAQAAYVEDLTELMAILAGARMEKLDVRAYEGEFLKTVIGEQEGA
jgi:quinol monooxygenase YgiN